MIFFEGESPTLIFCDIWTFCEFPTVDGGQFKSTFAAAHSVFNYKFESRWWNGMFKEKKSTKQKV